MQRLVKDAIILVIVYFATLLFIPNGIAKKMILGFTFFYAILFGSVSREPKVLRIYLSEKLAKILFFRKINYGVSIWAVIWAIWVQATTIIMLSAYLLNRVYHSINFEKLFNLYSSITLIILVFVCFLIAIPEAFIDITKKKRKW